jgi:dipeptidyl aminopeptidase/acylaminoacyl peptidase
MMHRVAVAAIAVGLAGCSTGGITDPGTELPEDRGTEIQTGVGVAPTTQLAWSADGTELYFQTSEAQPRLMAVPVTGGTARQLDGPRDGYVSLTVAPDGSALFFAANLTTGRRTAYRLPLATGAAEPLGPVSAFVAQVPADGGVVLPARDGSVFAVAAAPDSAVVFSGGSRTALATGCERVVLFSPDSRQLLCQRGVLGSGSYSIINVQTGASQQVQVVPQAQGSLTMLSWTSAGIRSLIVNPIGLEAYDVATAQTTAIWTAPQREIAVDIRHGTWSLDGSRIAFWIGECIRLRGLSQCDLGQSILYVVEPNTDREGVVAIAHGTQGGQSIALSPSGDRVAYVFDGRIYLQSTAIP